MIFKNKLFISIILLLFAYSCNYKPLLLNDLANYDIVEINTSGEKRIGHKLKNQIKFSNSNKGNPLSLDLKIKKNKTISEKNIKNKVTKYEINIVINVTVTNLKNNVQKNFLVVESGIYNSTSQYSSNLESEKNLINSLIDDLSDQIQKNIIIQLNDS